MNIENARKLKAPRGEYRATMTKPDEMRIYSETFFGIRAAVHYAREAVALGWHVEVIGPDSKIYFIGGES